MNEKLFQNFNNTTHQNVTLTGGGLLKLSLKEGTLFRNTETFGSMDPFIQIKFQNGHTIKSKVVQDGGMKPVWNQTLEIPIPQNVLDKGEKLCITCFDEDLIMDSFVGQESLTLSDFLS